MQGEILSACIEYVQNSRSRLIAVRLNCKTELYGVLLVLLVVVLLVVTEFYLLLHQYPGDEQNYYAPAPNRRGIKR